MFEKQQDDRRERGAERSRQGSPSMRHAGPF